EGTHIARVLANSSHLIALRVQPEGFAGCAPCKLRPRHAVIAAIELDGRDVDTASGLYSEVRKAGHLHNCAVIAVYEPGPRDDPRALHAAGAGVADDCIARCHG